MSQYILLAFLFMSCNRASKQTGNERFLSLDPEDHGIGHENNLTYTEDFNVYLYKSFYNGAGVGAGDLNNDGLVDLLFVTNQAGCKLYLNKGDFDFNDVTAQTVFDAEHHPWYTGVSIADVNGDGLLDVFLCKGGKPNDKNRYNELFINKGNDQNGIPDFTESSKEYGVDDIGFSVHAVFFDYDRDNDLDFYLLNNSISPSDIVIDAKQGMRDRRDPSGNKLYRNDGRRFTDVTEEAGIFSSAIGFGLGASIGDVNRDGWPDLYIANDFFEKDYLYVNQKDGTFRESIDESVTEISLGSMGVDIGDMNGDGWPEIFVTEMLPRDQRRLKTKALFDGWDNYKLKSENGYLRQFGRNAFQLNNGPTGASAHVSFSEVSRHLDVAATDWSWAALMADFDNDGLKDLYVTNGIVKDLLDQDYLDFYTDPDRLRAIFKEKGAVIKELIDSIPSEPIANFLFRQQPGFTFTDAAADWGLDQKGFSTGVAYADLDNDGDLDLVVNNVNAAPSLYKNQSEKLPDAGNFLTLTLHGRSGNVFAIGAQVRLQASGKTFFQELYPMRGTMSAVDNRIHIGLGKLSKIDSLEILWPDGVKTIRTNVAVNQFMVIDEKDEKRIEEESVVMSATLFADISGEVACSAGHIENDFNDFNYDVLLPYMTTNFGPPLAVTDLNRDGLSDFYLGGARDQAGSLFIQNKSGGFIRKEVSDFEKDKISEDTDAVFADIDGDGDADLLVGSGSYEFSPNSFALANRIYINKGNINFERSPQVYPTNKLNNTSVIKPSDVDGDGDLDLFAGSFGKPQQYGVDGDGYLLINDGEGNFSDQTKDRARSLLQIGMIVDAVWIDYDNDKDEDLFVVGHWMPVRAFRNNAGKLEEVTNEIGLSATSGLWCSIEKADLDHDGRMDLVCGNWGTNSMLKASEQKPLKLYVNDFDGNGSVENIITCFDGEYAYPIASKKELISRLPSLKKKYLRYNDYALQTAENIFSVDQLSSSKIKKVATTSSCVFWNNNGRFEKEDLPMQAQLAPIFASAVDDFDNDGESEILMGGNQFRAKPQLGVYGASFGLVVKVKGREKLIPLTESKSGVHIEGEIRSLAKIKGPNQKDKILVGMNNDSVRVLEVKDQDKLK